MTINKLTRIIQESYPDGTQVSRLPNNEEIINKINEIITYLNSEENEKHEVNPFAPRKSL